MSVTFSPITLTVTDSSGNVLGTAQIDQTVADALYNYFVAKLENDQTALSGLLNSILSDSTRVQAIANALVNDDTALDTLYQKIKERLKEDIIVLRAVQPIVPPTNGTATTGLTAFNQLFATLANLLPLQMLASMFTAQKSTFESVLESVLPLLVIVPILERIA